MKLNNHGQIFIYEIFLILMIIILILNTQIQTIVNYKEYINNKNNYFKILKNITDLDLYIKNGEYQKHLVSDKKSDQIYTIKIKNKIIYKNKIRNLYKINCYDRGIVENKKFKILEICYHE